MTTTATRQGKRSHLGAMRPRRAGYPGRSRDRRPPPKIRPGSLTRGLDGASGQESRAASAGEALVSGARAISPVLLALVPFGTAFGAAAMGSGLSALEALGMSVFVAAGAAQLAAVQLVAAGASVAVVVLTVLVINLRLALYSASIAPHFRRLPLLWKGLLSFHLTDQAYMATITRFEEGEVEQQNRRWYFLGVGLSIWTTWQAATAAGILLGAWASEGWSLDFVMPLIFIALAVPAVKDRTTGAAALSAGVAAMFVAAMPLNLGLIAATLIGVVGGLTAQRVVGRSRR